MISERKARRLVRRANDSAKARTRLLDAIDKELARGGGNDLAELEHIAMDRRFDSLVDALHAYATEQLLDYLHTAGLTRFCTPPHPCGSVAFCLAHGFLPDDPALQVVFFHAIGRADQAHALDPDRTLLTAGYTASEEAVRRQVRTAALGAGDPDVVRKLVTTDQRDRVKAMTSDQVAGVIGTLAGTSRWEELWLVVKEAAVTHLSELRRLPEGWQPDDQRQRRLLAALRSLGEFPAGDHALPPRSTTVSVRGWVRDLSIAPDGTELAVLQERRRFKWYVSTFGTRGDRRAERQCAFGTRWVLHEGGQVLTAAESGVYDHGTKLERDVKLCQLRHNTPRVGLAALPGRYVTAMDNVLYIGPLGGGAVTTLEAAELGLPPGYDAVCTDSRRGRIAVKAWTGLAVCDASGTPLAVEKIGHHLMVGFLDDGDLITSAGAALQRWTLTNGRLHLTAAARFEGDVKTLDSPSLARRPTQRLVVGASVGRLVFFDTETLYEVPGPEVETVAAPDYVVVGGPGGRFLATYALQRSYETTVVVHDLARDTLVTLLTTPVAAMPRSALRELADLRALGPFPGADGLLDALQILLADRFGADVALGDHTSTSAFGTDIMLSEGED